jgi:class 3 adenylate cyclase
VAATVSTGAILFTDMVGSTELRSRLGDDRADLLRKHHDDLLADVVASHRGEVLRWTGDGIKAAFATSSDAVAAAVDMQRRVAAYGAEADAVAPFEVRIGLGAGEVLIDDDDHHGVAVIEAARLEAMARPGEILATDMVRMLGHRRANVMFEELGERTLKGLDRPVLVHRVIDLTVGVVPPVPRVLAGDHLLPLVGRERQLGILTDAWHRARSGEAALVLVSGSPGLGKTRLVSHAAALAHAEGAIVLAGTCDSDLAVPYDPFAMAFREIATLDDALSLAMAQRTGSLARLFPGSTSSHAEIQPAMARFELFDAVVALVRRLTRLHPVFLVVDDIQWATAPTLLLLQHLVQELPDARLLLVATYRDEDLAPSHPARELLAAVRTSAATTRIGLAVLGDADVADMVAALAPSAPRTRVDEIARLVHGESGGSPFFAGELLRHLATTGQLERALEGATGDQLPVPDSVHDVVAQRLARLPDGAREILTSAAVIGPTFELDLLAELAGRSADDVLDLLDEVCRAGFVSEVGIDLFGFTHAIVRNALLDDLSATRLARAHRRVAEALEARGAEQFDELARHWRLAGMEAKSTVHLARAARRDMVALAYESARTRYQEVLDLLARDPQADSVARAEAWLGLGAAGRAIGDSAYTQAIARAARLARTARNPTLMAEAAALSTWPGTFFFVADNPDASLIELCEDALGLVDADDPMRVKLLATLASHLTFASATERRQALIAEAHELAARHDDASLTAVVLNAEFLCLWEPSTLERREQIARDLGRLSRAHGEPEMEYLSGFFTAYCLAERTELESGRAILERLGPVVDATRNDYFRFLTERLALSIDILRGADDAQARIDDLAIRFGATHADTDGTWALQSGGLAYQAGTLHLMLNSIEAMTAGNQARTWTAAQALALLWAGDRDGAEAILDTQTDIPVNYFWLTVVQVRAEVAVGIGRGDLCARMYDELLPFRGRLGITASGSLCYCLVSRTLGMLALALDDVPAALDLLTEAVGQADRIDAPFEGVIGRRLLASALLATGDVDGARDAVGAAHVVAVARGFAREVAALDTLRATLPAG